MLASTSSTQSPYVPFFDLPLNAAPGWSGTCDGRVGEVQKERTRFVFADEFHRFVGIDLLDAVLLGPVHRFDHRVVAHQRHRWFALAGGCIRRAVPFASHVVRIRKAQVMIKPTMDRQKRDLIAHMPFADALRRVALFAQQPGDRVLLGAKPHVCGGHNDFRQRDSLRIAAGQQLRPLMGA